MRAPRPTLAALLCLTLAGPAVAWLGQEDAAPTAQARVSADAAAPADPVEASARAALAEALAEHSERIGQDADGNLRLPYLPVPRTLAIDPRAWVRRLDHPDDGTIRIQFGGDARPLAPLSDEAERAFHDDLSTWGAADALRASLDAGRPTARYGAALVLARKAPALAGAPRAQALLHLRAEQLAVMAARPDAPAADLPLQAPEGVRVVVRPDEDPPRAEWAREAEYRRALRGRSGLNGLFRKPGAFRHPTEVPASPEGLRLSPEAWDALELGEGEWAWVVWWRPEATPAPGA